MGARAWHLHGPAAIANRTDIPDFEDGLVLPASAKRLVANGVSSVIQAVAHELDDAGTANTPQRVARMYDELLSGYAIDPDDLLNGALFDVAYDEMVVVGDIDFYSLCEHHLLPFYGRAHVGYLPNKQVVGLSKIPRIVDMYARRLQVQERLTEQIATFLDERISPRGVGVVIEASHLCTAMRGVKKPGAKMVTSALRGVFRANLSTREEFMAHVRHSGRF